MKILLVVVCVAGLGAVAGAMYVGVRLKEPTVVPDPYQAGLHYDEHRHSGAAASPCDLQAGPCTQRLPDGGEVTLALAPRPVRAMRDLEFTVSFAPASTASNSDVAVMLTMPDMYMGETRAALSPEGEGVFRGKGVVVRCPSRRKDWVVDVLVDRRESRGGAGERAPQRIARFPLVVAE